MVNTWGFITHFIKTIVNYENFIKWKFYLNITFYINLNNEFWEQFNIVCKRGNNIKLEKLLIFVEIYQKFDFCTKNFFEWNRNYIKSNYFLKLISNQKT